MHVGRADTYVMTEQSLGRDSGIGTTAASQLSMRNPRSCDACRLRKIRCERTTNFEIIDNIASSACIVRLVHFASLT